MANGVMLVENLWSTMQFPLHTLTSTELYTDHEVARIADGRRSPFDYFSGLTVNTQQDLTCTMDRIRAFDMVGIDRGHNLAGKTIEFHASAISDFSSYETVFSLVMPTVSAPGTVDDALGVRTEEGAWLIRVPIRTGKYLRFRVAAAASYKPIIVGLWTGLSWAPPPIEFPWGEEGTELIGERRESSLGWIAVANPTQRRRGTLDLKLNNLADYEQARYHVGGHFGANRPAWLIYDTLQAERAVLALRDGPINWSYKEGWGYRQASVGWIEHGALAA